MKMQRKNMKEKISWLTPWEGPGEEVERYFVAADEEEEDSDAAVDRGGDVDEEEEEAMEMMTSSPYDSYFSRCSALRTLEINHSRMHVRPYVCI